MNSKARGFYFVSCATASRNNVKTGSTLFLSCPVTVLKLLSWDFTKLKACVRNPSSPVFSEIFVSVLEGSGSST